MSSFSVDIHAIANTIDYEFNQISNFRSFILLAIEFFAESATAQKSREAEGKKNAVQTPIRLTIQIPRKTWRVREPIEVMAYLENVSQGKYFYVGRELFSLISIDPYHYIEISIKDEKNRDAPIGRMASAGYGTNESITEILARAYIQLNPGNIYGLKDLIYPRLSPGRYRLTTIYREVQALYWPEEKRKALPVPVWTERLVSNTITINVIR